MKFINEHLEELFIIPLMFIMSFLIFIQVVMRYAFQNSLVWSEELARYLFIWLVYFAVSYTAKGEKHIRIDAAINLYPKKLRPYVLLFSEVVVLAFSVFIAVTAITVFQKIEWSGQMSPAMRIPMQFVYAAPLIGFTLTAFRQVQCIARHVKRLGTPQAQANESEVTKL